MIQIAIVEDEEIYVKQLTEYIRKYQTERGRSIKGTVFGICYISCQKRYEIITML